MLGRAFLPLLFGLAALPACDRDGPTEPAIATPGTGIPMGAVGAVGASFDGPAAPPGDVAPAPRRRPPGKLHHAVPDPFADPPDPPGESDNDGGPAAAPRPRRSGGTAL